MILKSENKNERLTFLLAAIILFVTSFFSTGFHHFDEHFQILEFAGLKLGLTDAAALPWEYHQQMRPAFQPVIAFSVYKLFSAAGIENPFYVATFLRILSAFISLVSMLWLYRATKDRFQDKTLLKWFLILSFLSWFLFYNHVRFSSENWSGTFFILGFAYFFLPEKINFSKYLITGIFFGIAFICRYQSVFLIGGFVLWILLINKNNFKQLFLLLTGFILVFFAGFLIDKWFYGNWIFTSWNYFSQNILQDKVSNFGTDSWWYYFKKFFEQAIPPFSIVILLSFLVYFIYKRKDALTWSLLPFLLIHFLIGHKEMRFLYPLTGFVPLILISFFSWLQQINISPEHRFPHYFMKTYFAVNFIFLLLVMFRPADSHIALYKTVYDNFDTPVVIYFHGNDPYHRVCDVHFYKRANTITRPLASLKNIPEINDTTTLLAIEYKDRTSEFNDKYTLIYSTYPEWILNFNFNNWIQCSGAYYLYDLDH